jgi:predicted alpha/beta-hydrolase family hydrolase
MTSQAQALSPLQGVLGLVFFAFPLHAARRPSTDRGRHLFRLQVPLLFLQGTRDALADVALLEQLCAELGGRARLKLLAHADHAFYVLVRSGRTDAEVRREMLDAVGAWIEGFSSEPRDPAASVVEP